MKTELEGKRKSGRSSTERQGTLLLCRHVVNQYEINSQTRLKAKQTTVLIDTNPFCDRDMDRVYFKETWRGITLYLFVGEPDVLQD